MAHLINLNVERSRHLHRFIPFLASRQPDIVCLQELDEGDIPRVQSETGLAHGHFAPMARLAAGMPPFGVAVLSRTPITTAETLTYAGGGSGMDIFDRTDEHTRVATCRYAAVRVSTIVAGETLSVATTHFPWTPDGQPRPFQTDATERLIEALGTGPVILTGDFNAPRGGPVFDRLSEALRDCIPAGITTSIDPALHRAGALELMVDGLFATPHYRVSEVVLHENVSDHKAISAQVVRNN